MIEQPEAPGGALSARAHVKSAALEMTVIRADGRRETLGVVSYWHTNPLFRLAHRIGRALGLR